MKGHKRSINDMGHCAKFSLPGTRTGQSREAEQRVGMVWRPTAATLAASSGRHRKVSNTNAFISEVMVFWGRVSDKLPHCFLSRDSTSLAVLKVA